MKVGMALVGAGRMGAVHAAAIRRSATAELRAVVDVNEEAARAAAGGAPVFTQLEEALARPEVEAVVVAAPTPFHAAVTEAALESGRPALCEKPLSFDPAVSVRLAGRAAAAGLTLAVGFWRRFSPPWAAARRLLRAGAIGEPLFIRLSQWDAHPPPPAFCAREVSGGLPIDCGVHEFELMEFLLGKSPTSVRARALPAADREVAAAGDVDNCLIEAELEGGAAGIIDLSRNCRYGDDVRTEILGSEGALLADGLPRGRLRIGDRKGLRTVAGSETEDFMQAGVRNQLEAFTRAVREGGGEEMADGFAASRAVTVGLAAWESIDRGVKVTLPPPENGPARLGGRDLFR